MRPFSVITRTEITDSNFSSSTISEDDYAEWSDASVSYSVGDRRIVVTDHLVYECASDHTSSGSNGPSPEGDTAEWLIVGATNRWKMFDDAGNTVSTDSGSIEFEVTGDFVNSMGFLGIQAETIRIQAETGGANYYDETFTMADYANLADWYEYFTKPSVLQSQLVVFDIPSIDDSTYTITLTGSSTVGLGTFVMGSAQSLGLTEYKAEVGIISYSRKTEDAFGNITITPRLNRRTMDVSVVVERDDFDYVNRVLVDMDGKLALWVAADNDVEALTLYGFFRDFTQILSYPTLTHARLQIEGLI